MVLSVSEQGTACAMEGKTNDDSDDELGAWIYNSSRTGKSLYGALRRTGTASNAPATHKSERLVCDEDQTSRTAHCMSVPNECSKKSNDDGLVASLINTYEEKHDMNKRKLCVEKDDCPVTPKKARGKESSVAGCSDNAQRGGVCITYGEKVRTCSHERDAQVMPGQGESALGVGRKSKLASTAAVSALPRVCSHEGCSKRVFSVQVCSLHDGTNVVEAKPKKRHCVDMSARTISLSKDGTTLRYYKQCTHEGCESIAKKAGKCYSHGAVRKVCAVDGCTITSQKRGFCRRHFRANEEFARLTMEIESIKKKQISIFAMLAFGSIS